MRSRLQRSIAARRGFAVLWGEQQRAVWGSPPVRAAALVVAVALAVELVPAFSALRVLSSVSASSTREVESTPAIDSEGEVELTSSTEHRPELVQPEQVALPEPARGVLAGERVEPLPAIDVEAPPRTIVDATGQMAKFYRSLRQTAHQRKTTRIAYYGDSVVTSDYVTGTLRRKLQSQFGDAGHGFMLMANAWSSYFHNDVERFSTRGWKVSRIVGPYLKDGLYGFGGVSFKGPPGIIARYGTAQEGNFGRKVSRFEVSYLRMPGGGELEARVDGNRVAVIPTASERKQVGTYRVDVPDGPHVLELRTRRRMVRAFGVVMERSQPGVVLDALGVQGARIRFLDKQDDEHFAEQLRWRSPDLLVFQFGANESGDGFAYSMEDYDRTMQEIVRQALTAVPGASCLILSAMDRARTSEWGLITVPIIPHIVRQQRETAAALGCAFWDTYGAMGGKGSMARWYRRGLGQADYTHPTSAGADVLGNWLYQAIVQGYERWRANPKDVSGRGLGASSPPDTDAHP